MRGVYHETCLKESPKEENDRLSYEASRILSVREFDLKEVHLRLSVEFEVDAECSR